MEETKPREVNMELLRQISNLTGGRVFPTTAQLLDEKGSWVRERRPLWPYWLVLALLLNFVEVFGREKGSSSGLFSRLDRKAPSWFPLGHTR